MSNLAQKRVVNTPVKENKESKQNKPTNVVQIKLFSIITVWIAFVIGYFALSSGSETFMWIALGLIALTSGFLYMKN